jgi:glucan phosphoethanolaminetransferase (alkaline phosphatase superfamily)
MEKQKKLQWGLELIWWVLTILIALGVIYPIWSETKDYPFYITNFIFVVASITFARYIFLLKHTFLAYRERIKLVLIFLMIPVVFLLIQEVSLFQNFLDENGYDPFIQNVTANRQRGLGRYIHSQMLFFGVGSVIAGVLFPLRLVLSIWRQRNRGTV